MTELEYYKVSIMAAKNWKSQHAAAVNCLFHSRQSVRR